MTKKNEKIIKIEKAVNLWKISLIMNIADNRKGMICLNYLILLVLV